MNPNHVETRLPRRGSPRERGFTLIELVVAMAAGLLVSMSALILSRNATRFFQNEARISATQLAATLGMNRLTADLQRAAFLSVRNNATNKALCSPGSLTQSIAQLTGLGINIGGSAAVHPTDLVQSKDPQNGLNPDSLLLSGSYDASERFAVAWAFSGAGGQMSVDLQLDGAIERLRLAATQAGQTLGQALSPIFRARRFLRFIDNGGGQGDVWGIIESFSVTGNVGSETIRIVLQTSPTIPLKTQNTTCGLSAGANRGVFVSVVSRIKYDLRSLIGDPKYGPIVAPNAASAAITGEAGRTELVRVEIDPVGTEQQDTLELVAELAVDLKFGVTKAPPATDATVFNPAMTTYPFDDPEVAITPERVRAVQVRLSTRGRVPDRENPLSAGGRQYRFAVLQPPVRERWARLRTLYTTVALPNQADFTTP